MNPDHTPRPHNPPHSSSLNTGAYWPAYPVSEDNYPEPCRGLSKRELFAAMAMQGLLSRWDGSVITTQTAAALSIDAADALLAGLAKDGA